MNRTLAVCSPAGGAGVSTVALNLAALWAATGTPVALVDLSQYGALARLTQADVPPGAGLGPLAAYLRSDAVDAAEFAALVSAALVPCGVRQVSLLPAAVPQRQDDLRVTDVVALTEALSRLGHAVVLDTPGDLCARLAGALHAASAVLWLVRPDPAAAESLLALQGIAAADFALPGKPAGVVVSPYHRRCAFDPAELAALARLPLWGTLPLVPGLLPATANRGPAVVAFRRGPWGGALRRLAARLPGGRR